MHACVRACVRVCLRVCVCVCVCVCKLINGTYNFAQALYAVKNEVNMKRGPPTFYTFLVDYNNLSMCVVIVCKLVIINLHPECRGLAITM